MSLRVVELKNMTQEELEYLARVKECQRQSGRECVYNGSNEICPYAGNPANCPGLPLLSEEENDRRAARKLILQEQLRAYSEDAVQVQMGAYIPDWETRKAKFIAIHSELRQLEGKPSR